jgi:hypothetical protein
MICGDFGEARWSGTWYLGKKCSKSEIFWNFTMNTIISEY